MKKCEYWKSCPWYDLKGRVCNEEEGMYGGKEATCKNRMEELIRKNGR